MHREVLMFSARESGPRMHEPEIVWLSPEILSWQAENISWIPATSEFGLLAAKEWKHATLRLDPPCDEQKDREEDRKDAVAALWRAVERRIQLFESDYVISQLPSRTQGKLNRLQELGLVSGSVLSDIRDLRNEITHESADPPDREKCLIYRDAVWYFLRSTERFAVHIVGEFVLVNTTAPDQRIEISMGPPEWSITIRAESLPINLVSRQMRESWAPVRLAVSENYGTLFFPVRDSSSMIMTGFIDDTDWILALAQRYFSAT